MPGSVDKMVRWLLGMFSQNMDTERCRGKNEQMKSEMEKRAGQRGHVGRGSIFSSPQAHPVTSAASGISKAFTKKEG